MLDIEKEPSSVLVAAMNEILQRMCIISTARARAYDSVRVSIGKTGSSMPLLGGIDSPADYWHRRWAACRTDRARLLVVKGAQEALAAMTHAPAAERRRGTLEWKRAVATEGLCPETGQYRRTSLEVGGKFGISQSYVRRLRGLLRNGELGDERESGLDSVEKRR